MSCVILYLFLAVPGASDPGALIPEAPSFDDYFTGQTLRFDYYHSGVAAEEHISLDQLRLEGVWPGSRVTPLVQPAILRLEQKPAGRSGCGLSVSGPRSPLLIVLLHLPDWRADFRLHAWRSGFRWQMNSCLETPPNAES